MIGQWTIRYKVLKSAYYREIYRSILHLVGGMAKNY